MTTEQLKIYKSIDEILWFDWDPIGINKHGIRDEYSGYIPKVYKLKISGANKIEIAKYLDEVVTERMGMESNLDFSERIAEKL